MRRRHTAGHRVLRPGLMAGAMGLLVATGTAWASEGTGGHGTPWMDLLWKAVNFVVLAALLWYFGRKPMGAMLRSAASETKADLDGKRAAAHQADKDLARQRSRIENLEAELERMAGAAKGEAEAEHERLVAEARVQAERIRSTVQMQMEQEFSKARKELQSELAAHTVRLAEDMIRQRMDDASRERIVTRAIDQMEAGQ